MGGLDRLVILAKKLDPLALGEIPQDHQWIPQVLGRDWLCRHD